MKKPINCIHCGSDKVIPRVRIMDRDYGSVHDLSVRIFRAPNALFFKDASVSKLKANICCDCGRLEWLVDNPKGMWRAYQEYLKKLG